MIKKMKSEKLLEILFYDEMSLINDEVYWQEELRRQDYTMN